jgi:hypothetical protein
VHAETAALPTVSAKSELATAPRREMILDRLDVTPDELERQTGWELKPEGLCKDDRCVPLPAGGTTDGLVDVTVLAERLGMPLVHDDRHDLWALGPEAGDRVLASAQLPPIVLADVDGHPFDLASLRGEKVLIAAWASW